MTQRAQKQTPPIACRLEVLPGDTVAEKVRHAAASGFDGVGLPGRYLDDFSAELKSFAPDSPLPFVSLSLGFKASLVSPNSEERRRCAESLARLLAFCRYVGGPCFNMPPVLLQDVSERVTGADADARQDRLLLEQLPPICDEAARNGVTLLLEPVNRFESDYLNTVGHAARLCRAVDHPNLGLTADFFHMQMEELNAEDAIRAAGACVRHVHVAENTRVEPGPGSMDFDPGFRALKAIGYTGVIEVECRNLSGPAEDVLPASVRYLRACWESS